MKDCRAGREARCGRPSGPRSARRAPAGCLSCAARLPGDDSTQPGSTPFTSHSTYTYFVIPQNTNRNPIGPNYHLNKHGMSSHSAV